MKREDVEGAIHVFPAPDAPPELKWDGEILSVIPDTAWSPQQTYVITLQAEARDRRGNRLVRSLQVAFSTGEQIDSGTIAGRVFRGGRTATEAVALCYRLDRPDVNPELDTADYVVQVDSSGAFEFSFLSPGTYRVFALEDRDRDWLWNTGVEPIAVPSRDVEVGGRQDVTLPPLFLVPLDTVRPVLLSCRALSHRMARVQLDKPSDSIWLSSASVELQGASSTHLARALYAVDSLADHFYALFDDSVIASGGTLGLSLPEPWAYVDTCRIEPPVHEEQPAAMALRRTRPDTLTGGARQPDTLYLDFDHPLQRVDVTRISSLDSSARRFEAQISGPFTIGLSQASGQPLRDSIQILFLAGAVSGEGGALWPTVDSLALKFSLPADDSMGLFEIVLDQATEPLPEGLILSVQRMGMTDHAGVWDVRSTRLRGELLHGAFALALLADSNGDRRFAPGWPYPYRPSEALWPLSDTLEIRARFTTELHLDWRAKK